MTRICICGAGTMGTGIAQVTALAGYYTVLYDLDKKTIERASKKMSSDLQKFVDKKKITPEKRDMILQEVLFTTDINQCKADLVIEAIIERLDAKLSLFRQLSEINAATTIYASNTSSLSINVIGKELSIANRFAGLHFFNPAPIMKLVEVVKGENTEEKVVSDLVALTIKLGKTPVVCKDSPGFIVNRVARPFYIEALRIVEEGTASIETIDRVMENIGFKMGPFKLMDLIGNDVNYAVSCSVWEQLGKPRRLLPSGIQKEKVENGELGKKTGKGYYDYSPQK
jgi:3-hydroxybutyryl-CoA dehydrogenase